MEQQQIKYVYKFILLLMRHIKQKPQPFFVKRIRLRKSIIKTNEILEMISNYDLQSSKYTTISESFKREEKPTLKVDLRKISPNKLDELELGTYHSDRIDKPIIKNIVKIYKNRNLNEKTAEMHKIGLQVRRIFGDPKHKRSYQYSCHTIDRSKNKEKSYSNPILNLTYSNKFTFDAENSACQTEKNIAQMKLTQKNVEKCCTIPSSTRKNRAYLYQKLANKQATIHHEQNHVYEKRIKSYTQFLWKCLIAHNVYVNLDLRLPNNSLKKIKAYVGFGNNCNMIKGLIKRRFWWTISEELTDDCLFIWTQIKINKIYERQQRGPFNQSVYKDQCSITYGPEDFRFTQSSILQKRNNEMIQDQINNEQFQDIYQFHTKIWNKEDFRILRPIYKRKEFKLTTERQAKHIKQKSYKYKTDEVIKKCKQIICIENLSKIDKDAQNSHNFYIAKPIIHNHLQNNFFLGNKKALFYNLRQYYDKIGQNVFTHLPLTFHIRQGFKDPEYLKFTKYFQMRAKMIKQQQNNDSKTKKMRNIWIVKPGENSNQGRGITVIDEIYELNTIIKQSMPRQNSRKKDKEDNAFEGKTFIVQLYIDRPFLYYDRKFDIRHYMLITNIYGVTRAYWYEEGYIRTSSYIFNINNFEPQIHLTNDAIQKKYPQYGRYEPYNKISYSEYQNYLNSIPDRKYNFKEQILTKMKNMAKDAARSVYTKISPQNQMHNFQIFGLDFMIDRNFKPWLIEINTNPCLDCTCPLLDRIIPYMVEQGLKLSLDIVYPPPCHYPNTNKHYAPLINLENFKYELIFDSISEGQQLRKLYTKNSNNILNVIGPIQEDEQFKDNGKEIKLQDFT